MDKVRTVSDTKRDFYQYHTRPINSVYRRFVEELMVEMHLLAVNVDFRYDPIYALGAVTSFERFMLGYQPEADRESIFDALCRAVGGNPERYRRDAAELLTSAQAIAVADLMAKLRSPAAYGEDNLLLQSLRAVAENPRFKYSRLFAIGLYTALSEAEPELIKNQENCQQTLQQLSESLHLTPEKLQKDLDLYRSNLDKIEQLLGVLEETLQADRKQRQQRDAEIKPANN